MVVHYLKQLLQCGREKIVFERAIIYYNYLQHYFGEEIAKRHRLHIIKNVGHSSKGLMHSKNRKELFFSIILV